MKHSCAWCGVRPVVYRGTEYCSYHCWAASLQVSQEIEEQEEVPEPEGSKQLDLFKLLPHTR